MQKQIEEKESQQTTTTKKEKQKEKKEKDKMQRKLKNQTKSMDAVTRFCLKYPAIITLISALGTAVAALGLKVQSILSLEALQEANEKGVAMTKKEKKISMVTLAYAMAGAGQGYAIKNNLLELFEKLRFSPKGLIQGNSQTAIAKCELVYNLLFAIPLATRSVYGLTDTVLETYNDAISDFKNEESSNIQVRTIRKTQTRDLAIMVKEGMKIMRNEVVKVAAQLESTEPAFYNTLLETSKVVSPTTETKIRVEVADDVTRKALAQAKVTVMQTGESGVTSKSGLCSLYIPYGDYTLEIALKDYTTMTLDVHVKKGSNTVHVDLAPAFVVPAEIVEKVAVEK